MSRIMAKMNTVMPAFCVNCYLKPIKTLPHSMHSSAQLKAPSEQHPLRANANCCCECFMINENNPKIIARSLNRFLSL